MLRRALRMLGLAAALAPLPAPAEPVTVDNYSRAETDEYARPLVAAVGVDGFQHIRLPTPLESQGVRMNRDMLYSMALLDLTKPVKVVLPDAGRRYLSMQIIDQDHYTKQLAVGPGSYTLSGDEIGTRYAFAIVRIAVDAKDPFDVEAVNALQDRIALKTAPGGRFEVPDWDRESLRRLREALLVLAASIEDTSLMFGDVDEVDPIHHLLGTASSWGGLPAYAAQSLSETPARNDGQTPHALTVKAVPVDGSWSISVYDRNGHFAWNEREAYVVSERNAVTNPDGSVSVHFGACEDARVNCLPITPGWSYVVRLYQPQAPILEGRWSFPKPEPVD